VEAASSCLQRAKCRVHCAAEGTAMQPRNDPRTAQGKASSHAGFGIASFSTYKKSMDFKSCMNSHGEKHMKTEFDSRCDRLRKQIKNAKRDLKHKRCIERAGKKALGPFESEFKDLCQLATTAKKKKSMKELEELLSGLNVDWFCKVL
jgi:hypothetical protein